MKLNRFLEMILPVTKTLRVGTVYQTFDADFDPNDHWPGTWERIEDCFLLGGSTHYPVDNTDLTADGGEEAHSLTSAENGAHTHTGGNHYHGPGAGSYYANSAGGLPESETVGGKYLKSQRHQDTGQALIKQGWVGLLLQLLLAQEQRITICRHIRQYISGHEQHSRKTIFYY